MKYTAKKYKYRFWREGGDISLIPIICHGKRQNNRTNVREKTTPVQLFAVFLNIRPREGKFGGPPCLMAKPRGLDNQQSDEKNQPTGQEADDIYPSSTTRGDKETKGRPR